MQPVRLLGLLLVTLAVLGGVGRAWAGSPSPARSPSPFTSASPRASVPTPVPSGVTTPAPPPSGSPGVSPSASPDVAPAVTPDVAPTAEQPVTNGLDAPSTVEDKAVPLKFMNRRIVLLRAPLFGYSPQERAVAAVQRLQRAVRSGNPGKVTITQGHGGGRLVVVGAEMAFTVLPEDLNPLLGENLDDVTAEASRVLQLALQEALEQRSVEYMAAGAGRGALATVLGILLLALVMRGRRWMHDRIQVMTAERVRKLSLGELSYFSERVQWTLERFLDIVVWVTCLELLHLWAVFCLRQFPYTRPLGDQLGALALAVAARIAAAVASSVPGLLLILFTILMTAAVARGLGHFFTAVELGRVPMPEAFVETVSSTRRLSLILLWLFALIVAYPYFPGSGTDAFKGVSVFLGLVLSLGASGVVGQAASGVILTYARAFKEGDYVRIADTEGTVVSVGFLSTKIRTPKREEVNIPNSVLVASTTKNFSRLAGEEGVIVHTTVTIGYDTPWRQVHALLQLAADRTPGLRESPAPFVMQTSLDDFYASYQLNAHLEDPHHRSRVLALLHAQIQDAFNEYGVQIMSPNYRSDPESEKVVPRERWYLAPAKSEPGSDSAL